MSAIGANVNSVSQPTADIGRQLSRSVELTQPAISSKVLATANAEKQDATTETASDFVRVSSSIGRAATAGQLSRQEAIDIYRQIASLL
ncbi:hypothetical protein [Rheinheimera gaetbuli]